MLSRFTVTMCVSIPVVGEKLRSLPGRPRDFWHCIFSHRVCFIGANYSNHVYVCRRFGSLGNGFGHQGELLLSLKIDVHESHRIDN